MGGLLYFDNSYAKHSQEIRAGALLDPGQSLWNGSGRPVPSLYSATWAALQASVREKGEESTWSGLLATGSDASWAHSSSCYLLKAWLR